MSYAIDGYMNLPAVNGFFIKCVNPMTLFMVALHEIVL